MLDQKTFVFFLILIGAGCSRPNNQNAATSLSIKTVCLISQNGKQLCKQKADQFLFGGFNDMVSEIRVAFDYRIDPPGPISRLLKCMVKSEAFSKEADSGCPSDGTSGNLVAVFKKPEGFDAGQYLLDFEHNDGSWAAPISWD